VKYTSRKSWIALENLGGRLVKLATRESSRLGKDVSDATQDHGISLSLLWVVSFLKSMIGSSMDWAVASSSVPAMSIVCSTVEEQVLKYSFKNTRACGKYAAVSPFAKNLSDAKTARLEAASTLRTQSRCKFETANCIF